MKRSLKFVLVTGGAGFIASNLIELLLKKKEVHKIYSLDNYFSGSKNNHLKSKKIRYIKGNTWQINSIKSLKGIKFTAIFHFGEFSRIVQSFTHSNTCFKSNILGTLEVIKFASIHRSTMIYSASSSKFGRTSTGKNEHLSPYSWSKSKNIELIKNYSRWFSLDYEIVYFFNVYGPKQIKNHFMSAVIAIFEESYLNNKPLPVVKPGTQRRDFTHVSDIVRGVYLAFKKGRNDEYLLGTGRNYSINQIASLFKCKIKYVDKRVGERFSGKSMPDLAKKHLNYRTTIDIKEYIKKFIKKNRLTTL